MADKEKQPAKSKSIVPKGESSEKNVFEKIKIFSEEVIHEYKKIVWPKRKVTFGLTGIVVVMVILLSIYLGSVDALLGKLVASLL